MARVDQQDLAQKRMAKKYGIAATDELRCGVNKYRWDLIERDTAKFLGRRRDVLVGRPNTYPETLVSYMAGIYLSCCYVEKRVPSENLLHLASQQLKMASFGTRGAKEKDAAIEKAQLLRMEDPEITDRKISKLVGVPPSTVGRWVKRGRLAPALRK